MGLFDILERKYQNRHIERKYRRTVRSILRRIKYYEKLEPEKLPAELLLESNKLKNIIAKNPSLAGDYLSKAYAVFSQATRLSFGWAPNETQILAAVLLWHGKVVEMASGEGKTITAALPAYLQGLTGRGMHIITTNDYLAERDKKWIGIVFNRLGMSCGVVTQATPKDARQEEYKKDITYISNQEIGFDYLRDNLAMNSSEKILSGFPFAIIDEIDSILIDEARTPLIISEAASSPQFESLPKILYVLKQLVINKDYEADFRFKTVNFTDEGISKISGLFGQDIFLEGNFLLVQQLRFALYASVFLKKDRDYVVDKDKIILVDEFTGHPMPDRRLLDGLQQMVEAINGVPIREEDQVAATITYHDLFKMYQKIAGMSGTVMAAKEEFSDLYNLEAVKINPHRSINRIDLPTLFFRTEIEKFNFILKDIQNVHANGDPILVVGKTLAQVKYFSDLLNKTGLNNNLLHAQLTEKEFDVVKNAGARGALTVATNMAGRGTDIILEPELKEINGLVVYSLEPNLSKRIDDQLRGRSGRQGSRGVTNFFASLEDEIFQVYSDDKFWDYVSEIDWPETGVSNKRLLKFLNTAQDIADSIAAETRKKSVQFESVINQYSKANYDFRDGLLKAGNVSDEMVLAARRVMLEELPNEFDEYELFWIYADMIGALKQEAINFSPIDYSFGALKIILGDVLSQFEKTSLLPFHIHEKIRSDMLSFNDDRFMEYLDQLSDLHDRIFVEAAAENPLAEFTIRSNKMFHQMRYQIALNIVKTLFNNIIKT